MLSKCANPSCSTPFRYLRDGKLFQVEIEPELRRAEMAASVPSTVMEAWGDQIGRRIEFFWLCGSCSEAMTLAFEKGRGVFPIPLPRVQTAAAA